MNQVTKRVVCVGGGHCNCQVLKALKKYTKDNQDGPKINLTLVTEARTSFYSGMLPGTVSTLYNETDLMIELDQLAKWCNAEFIQKRVSKVVGNENKLILEDGSEVAYDVLALNVGSKTKDTNNVKGVWEHSLTTRPINDLLGKVVAKENDLKEKGIIPTVVVCGGGAAGTELSMAFKRRWTDFFGQDIKLSLISARDTPVSNEVQQTRDLIRAGLEQRGIDVINNSTVTEVRPNSVLLNDGREIPCDVAVWATGADPHTVSADSDLDILKGFFRVNDHLQSTSHPNVFGGGDCI